MLENPLVGYIEIHKTVEKEVSCLIENSPSAFCEKMRLF